MDKKVKQLIDQYKSFLFLKGGLEACDELYKWELITKQIGHPDIKVSDFKKEIKKLAFRNLCYSTQVTAVRNLALYIEEEYKKCFIVLFDENVDIQERIEYFIHQCDVLWNKIKDKFSGETSSMCDERLISCFLTFHNPAKYTFYKDSVYQALCAYLNIQPRKAKKKLSHYYELLHLFISQLLEDAELLSSINEELIRNGYIISVPLIAQDILWHFSNGRLNKFDESESFSEKINFMKEVALLRQKKQIILQGAPGTGKTYKTAEIAVSLCDDVDTSTMSRKEIMQRYKELKEDEGRIAFTTFHQSYDYEEFIEGIKPSVDSEEQKVVYEVRDGVFKNICKKADYIEEENEKEIKCTYPTIWKVSLQGTGDNLTRTDCMENNRIRIGWDQYGENIDDTTDFSQYGGKAVLDAFINKMQIGDYVLSCYSARTIDAIGIVAGEYEWNDAFEHYKRCRRVNWIVKGINEDIYERNNNTVMTLSSVYKLNNFNYDKLDDIVSKYQTPLFEKSKREKPYILIIDEINRGNISKIFGELITLLEADKRIGEENEVTVTLPYSQQTFGVPSNLYIIGTMNTADRSVGYIDYAVRRRFAFVTLKADRTVIENYYTDKSLREKALCFFDQVNGSEQTEGLMRVSSEYEKEDLVIGHSYFLALSEEELTNKMVYEVRPLLLEYFNEGLLSIKKEDDAFNILKHFGEK